MAEEAARPFNQSPVARFRGLPKKVTIHLEKESDRGSILILAAYAEEILGLILRESCTSDELGVRLLKYRAPAGDFSSKIAVCEAFGMISSEEASALHSLRKIRNAAAHFDPDGRGFDVLFDSSVTIDRVRSFLVHLNLSLGSLEPQHVRAVFEVACRMLCTRLLFRLSKSSRRPMAKSGKEEANLIREKYKDTEIGKILAEAEARAKEGDATLLFELLESLCKAITDQTTGDADADSA